MTEIKEKQRKGFAVIDPARQREIASLGGKAAQELGKAHRWNSSEAKIAARKSVEVRRAAARRQFNPRDVALVGGDPSL